jgi:hypothetical protein
MFLMIGTLAAAATLPANAAELAAVLKTLRAVGPNGAGHREATRAWAALVRQADASALPVMLEAMDGANPLAANWLRTAIDAVAERGVQQGQPLPAAAMEKYVLDVRHSPQGRRLAYEWLLRLEPQVQDRVIPRMLNDSSLEMRRDAVARLLGEVSKLEETGQSVQALAGYQRALAAARDEDQVRLLAGRLKRLGDNVDLPRHFGFVTRWQVIGPFDNTEQKGFDIAYPPERKIDLAATYEGPHGPLKWGEQITRDDFGKVDLNIILGERKSVLAYATADFLAPRRQAVEFRCTSDNAVKLWLNDRLIDVQHVYHSGSALDQYVTPAILEQGRNVILVKVGQNALDQEWARGWSFQLRVCDPQGTAILSADRDKP